MMPSMPIAMHFSRSPAIASAVNAITGISDQDLPLAVQSRKMLLDRLTNEDMLLVGFHLPNGGIGRAVKDSSSYRFVSESAQ